MVATGTVSLALQRAIAASMDPLLHAAMTVSVRVALPAMPLHSLLMPQSTRLRMPRKTAVDATGTVSHALHRVIAASMGTLPPAAMMASARVAQPAKPTSSSEQQLNIAS